MCTIWTEPKSWIEVALIKFKRSFLSLGIFIHFRKQAEEYHIYSQSTLGIEMNEFQDREIVSDNFPLNIDDNMVMKGNLGHSLLRTLHSNPRIP